MAARPALAGPGTRTLVVSECFPPRPGGSSTTMVNLLSQFDPESFSVATAGNTRAIATESDAGIRVHDLVRVPALPHRPRRFLLRSQRRLLGPRLRALVGRTRPDLVLGVYPDLDFLAAALAAADAHGVPFVAYLHDAPVEVAAGTDDLDRSEAIFADVTRRAAHLFVMSEGMRAMMATKYGIETTALEHVLPERPATGEPSGSTAPLAQVFWGGAVHTTNRHGVGRLLGAAAAAGYPFATSAQTGSVDRTTAPDADVRYTFFEARRDFCAALDEQGALLLAIDWPDETSLHRDELATVFPTKTVEYLASGRPIVAHCPDDYFLAEFLRSRGIGHVVSERTGPALADALRAAVTTEALPDAERARRDSTLELFTPRRVASLLTRELQAVLDR